AVFQDLPAEVGERTEGAVRGQPFQVTSGVLAVDPCHILGLEVFIEGSEMVPQRDRPMLADGGLRPAHDSRPDQFGLPLQVRQDVAGGSFVPAPGRDETDHATAVPGPGEILARLDHDPVAAVLADGQWGRSRLPFLFPAGEPLALPLEDLGVAGQRLRNLFLEDGSHRSPPMTLLYGPVSRAELVRTRRAG